MRFNLFAGPGAGKSTTAADQFARAKKLGHSIELISEYVKSWAIAKRAVVEFDQVYLMGKQLHYEHRVLSNGIRNIITDSPVLLSACYTRAFYPNLSAVADHIEGIHAEYEKQYPSVNIFLDRGDKEYKTEGRYRDRAGAVALDMIIRETLHRLEIKFKVFDYADEDGITAYINSHATV